MTQHGGTPGWLEESDPSGWYLCCEGRSMPPSLTGLTWCVAAQLRSPGKSSCCCWCSITECTQKSVMSFITQGRQARVETLVRPLPSLCTTTANACETKICSSWSNSGLFLVPTKGFWNLQRVKCWWWWEFSVGFRLCILVLNDYRALLILKHSCVTVFQWI